VYVVTAQGQLQKPKQHQPLVAAAAAAAVGSNSMHGICALEMQRAHEEATRFWYINTKLIVKEVLADPFVLFGSLI
jgi:hypothetical protein